MIKVVTTNIRFDNPADKEHNWSGRREILSSFLNSYSPDIFGTQEGWQPQLNDLHSLVPDYLMSDSHRDWIEDRMYPTIFVKKDRFDILTSGDIWLSETPEVPATKSFGSAFPRLCTWAKVRDKDNQKELFIVDVHLDHLKTETRQEQIKVLITEVQKVNTESLPMFLLGDFNEAPQDEVRRILVDSSLELVDPWFMFRKKEEPSHHNFKGHREDGARIDWILCSPELTPLEIELYKENDQGIYPSDHFPVFASFKF